LLIRNIASVFDSYLTKNDAGKFSKAIWSRRDSSWIDPMPKLFLHYH
jgi:hypothetical protein